MQTKTLTENNSSLIMPTTNIILSQEQLLQSQYLVNLPDDELKNILNSSDHDRINNYNYKEEMTKKKNEIDLKYLKELKKVYEKSPKLTLEILRSYNLKKGEILKIDAYGMIKSFRNKKDGYTYFGYFPNDRKSEVDFILKPIEENFEQRFIGKHFQIKFNPEDLNYYLKDLGHGYGTFIRINDWVEIKNNLLLNIGENYLIFSLVNEENDDNVLNIKLFSVSNGQNVLNFKKENSPITIGRKPENDLYLEDNMLSRVHCTINFKDNKWFLIDGCINNENGSDTIKKSTNGSWIYAFEDTLIYNKMCFKASHYLFECNLIDISSNNNSFSNKKIDLNLL
jgi:hypothetical protein